MLYGKRYKYETGDRDTQHVTFCECIKITDCVGVAKIQNWIRRIAASKQ